MEEDCDEKQDHQILPSVPFIIKTLQQLRTVKWKNYKKELIE